MSTAFVLSDGGSLGGEAGMLQALTERQVSADLPVGTSSTAAWNSMLPA
jgi:hypothetical protein